MRELRVMLERRAERGARVDPDDVIERALRQITAGGSESGPVPASTSEPSHVAAGPVEQEYPLRAEAASRRARKVWAVVGIAAVSLFVAGVVAASRGDVESSDAVADDRDALVRDVLEGPMSPIWTDPAEFPAQLAASREIYGHVEIGMPCSATDPSWISDSSLGMPTVFPVAEWDDDGHCTIRGFAMSGIPWGIEWSEDGSAMFPIRDDDGNIIGYSSTFPIYDAEGNVIGYQD